MAEELEKKKSETPDVIELAINTPDDKMCQFTVIPTGGVNAFAMSDTIQQFGKNGAFDKKTPMERYMQTIYKFNRSRGGLMLAGLLKLAQIKAEVSADEQAEARAWKIGA